MHLFLVATSTVLFLEMLFLFLIVCFVGFYMLDLEHCQVADNSEFGIQLYQYLYQGKIDFVLPFLSGLLWFESKHVYSQITKV